MSGATGQDTHGRFASISTVTISSGIITARNGTIDSLLAPVISSFFISTSEVTADTIYTAKEVVGNSFITNVSAASLSIKDTGSEDYKKITLTNNQLGIDNIPVLTNVVMGHNLTSTVAGLGQVTYVSSLSLQSTVAGLSTFGYINRIGLQSTVAGLGTSQYVSSLSLQSTVAGLGTSLYVSSSGLASTVAGLGTSLYISSSGLQSTVAGLGTTYVSTLSLQSTVAGLSTFGYINRIGLQSTVAGLGITYLSTLSLQSTLEGLGTYGYVSSTGLQSTVGGLGRTYVSSISLQSTVAGLGSSDYVSSLSLQSTVAGLGRTYLSTGFQSTVGGLGASGYVSSLSLQSTVAGLPRSGYVVKEDLVSTVDGIGQVNYMNSFLLQSTVAGLPRSGYIVKEDMASTVVGLGTSQYVSSLSLQSTVAGLGTSLYVSSSGLQSTVAGLGTSKYVSSLSLQSTVAGLDQSGYIVKQTLASTVAGLGTSTYVSSLSLQSTVAGLPQSGFIVKGDMASTVFGLKDSGYVNNVNLQSTVAGLGQSRYLSTANLQSTVTGLGSQGYVSSFTLQSTIAGLGSLGYLSSIDIQPFVQNLVTAQFTTADRLLSTTGGLGTAGYVSSLSLQSTVGGLGRTYLSSLYNPQTQTSSVLASTVSASNISASNITVANLSATNTVNMLSLNAASINNSTFYTSSITASTVNVNGTIQTRVINISTVFTNVTTFATGFNSPYGMDMDSFGNIYLADYNNNRIRKINSSGQVTNFAGDGVQGFLNGQGVAARFNFPSDIAVGPSGNIYVADAQNNMIRMITSSGAVTTFAGTGATGSVDDLVTRATFFRPSGIFVDANENIYVADSGNNKLRKISQGVVTTLTGASAVVARAQSIVMNNPQSLAVDSQGNIIVADTGNHKITMITPDGYLQTIAGSGGAGSTDGIGVAASFNQPHRIKLDGTGNIYVADSGNNKIRKISIDGVVTTVAGDGAAGYIDGDGILTRFNNPRGLMLTSSGDMFIGDSGNNLVRRLRIPTALSINGNATFTGGYVGIGTNKPAYPLDVIGNANVSGKLYANIMYNSSLQVSSFNAVTIDVSGNATVSTLYASSLYNDKNIYTSSLTTSSIFVEKIVTVGSNLLVPMIHNSSLVTSTVGATNITASNVYAISTTLASSAYIPFIYNSSLQTSSIVASTVSASNITASNVYAISTTLASSAYIPFIYNSSLQTSSIVASTVAASNITMSNMYGISTTLESTAYIPFIYNSSLQTSSIMASTVSASNITASNVYAISTTLASSAYIPFIYNSSLQTSSIVASTVSASNITMSNLYGISTTLASSAYIPFIYNSSLQTSSIVASTVAASNITMSNMYGISTTLARTAYIPHIYNSSLQTSSIMTSSLTVNGEANTRSVIAGSDLGSTDGIGQAARLNRPAGIAKDSYGNFYVTDSAANKIRKISPGLPNVPGNIDSTSIVTTIAGTGATGYADGSGNSATFNNPYGIAVAPNGNVYIADTTNNMIRMIDTAGNVTTVAGHPSSGYVDGLGTNARFNKPYDITVDANGIVYVADTFNNCIRKIDASGNVTTYAGTNAPGYNDGPVQNALFNNPYGITITAAGVMYIADTLNNRIRAIQQGPFNAGLLVRTVAGNSVADSIDGIGNKASFVSPYSIDTDTYGNLFISDTARKVIRKLTIADSNVITLAIGFSNPTGLVAFGGDVYVADMGDNKVYKIYTQTSTTIYGNVNFKSGNIGIGVEIPAYKLDVNGNANINGNLHAPVIYNNVLITSTIYASSFISQTFNISSYETLWVAVGNGIQISKDGMSWAPANRVNLEGGNAYSVAYNGLNTWVATTDLVGGTCIQYSKDGTNWLPSLTGGDFRLGAYGVAWQDSGKIWVAVGDSSGNTLKSIQTSVDGMNWLPILSGGFIQGNAVACSQSSWVAVGLGSSVASSIQVSSDGLNWTSAVTGGFPGMGGLGVAWNGAMWVAVGDKNTVYSSIQYSYDGSNWFNSESGDFSNVGHAVAWNGSIWVAVGKGATSLDNMKYSSNGIHWFSSAQAANTTQMDAVSWAEGKWIAVGDGSGNVGNIQVSADGISWQAITENASQKPYYGVANNYSRVPDFSSENLQLYLQGHPNYSLSTNQILATSSSVVVNNTLLVERGTHRVGINTYSPEADLDVKGDVNVSGTMHSQATTSKHLWIAMTTSDILHSADGLNWKNNATAAFSVRGNAVAWNGSMWVAVGKGATSADTIKYSLNGFEWINATNGFSTEGKGVAWNGSMWVAVGDGASSVKYSTDGIQWVNSPQAMLLAGNGCAVAWNGAMWVAVGSGYAICSADGKTWQTSSTGGFSTNGRGLAWNGTMWVAVGVDTSANMQFSYDAITWAPVLTGAFSVSANAVAWNGSIWVAVGKDTNSASSIKYSYDGLNWLNSQSGGFTDSGNTVAWDGTSEMWMVGGSATNGSGSIQVSMNGINWNTLLPNTPGPINGLCYSQIQTPDYSSKLLNLFLQGQPNFLTSTNQILATPSTIVVNNTLFIDRTTNCVGVNKIPSLTWDLDVNANIRTSNLYGISTTLESTAYIPYIYNSSMFTSSIMTSTLTAPQAFVSAIMTSTVTAPQLFISAIMTSTVTAPQQFISAIMTSTVTAPQLFISAIMTSTVTAPQLFISAIMTSTVTAPQLFISAIMTSTVTAPQLFISSIMTSTVTAPQQFISAIMTSTVTAPQLFISAIMTSTVTAPQLFISSIMTSTVTAPQQFISAIMTSTVTAPQLFISAIMTSTVTAPQLFISAIMTSTVTAPQLFISSIMTSTVTAPQMFISAIMTSTVTAPQLFISAIMTSTVTAPQLFISAIMTSTVTAPQLFISAIMTSTLTAPQAFVSAITASTLTASNIIMSNIYGISTTLASTAYIPFIYNSSLQTSSIMASTLTSKNITTLSLSAVSTIIQSNLYVPFIYNSSLQTSSIMASTVTADEMTVATKLTVDGIPMTSAAYSDPYFQNLNGICFDPAGNMYVADEGMGLIRKLTPLDYVTTLAGDVSGSTFSTLKKVVYDPFSGKIIAVDYPNRICSVDSVAGTVTQMVGGLNGVSDVCCDGTGNYYASASSCIYKIFNNTAVIIAGSEVEAGYVNNSTGVYARFDNITGITMDKNKAFLYVSDSGNRVVRKVSVASPFSVTTLVGRVPPLENTVTSITNIRDVDNNAPQLWLDGKDPLNGSALSGTSIQAWYDKSGNNRHATGTNASPPTIDSNGSITFYKNSISSTYQFTGVETGFIVVSIGTTKAEGTYTFLDTGFGVSVLARKIAISFVKDDVVYVNNVYIEPETSIPENTIFLLSYTITPTLITLFYNGTVFGTTSWTYTGSSAANTIIGDNNNISPGSVTISEVILYNKELSAANKQSIEAYLIGKWNIDTPSYLPPNIPETAFSPPSGLRVWLDGADPDNNSGTTTAAGAMVSQWNDKSGNGNHASASYFASPSYVSGGGILFQGSQYYITNYTAVPTTETGFIVVSLNNIYAQGDLISGSANGARQFAYVNSETWAKSLDLQAIYGSYATTALFTSPINPNPAQKYIFSYTTSSASRNIFVNGVCVATGAPATYFSGSGTTQIGSFNSGSTYLKGIVYEVMLFNTVLSDNDRLNVENYLNGKWDVYVPKSLKLWLDSSDPYANGTPAIANEDITRWSDKSGFNNSASSGLVLWLDASDPNGTGVPVSGTFTLTSWVDKSGYNYNAIPTGTVSYTRDSPSFLPGIQISNGVVAGNFLTCSIPSGTFENELDFFIVYKNTNISGAPTSLLLRTTLSNTSLVPANPFDAWATVVHGGVNGMQAYTSPYNLNTSASTTTLLNYNLSQVNPDITGYSNGSKFTLTGTTGTPWVKGDGGDILRIGGYTNSPSSTYNTSFNGTIYELLVFNTKVADAQRLQIEAYLSWKWKIQGSLSSSNPYKSIPIYNPSLAPTVSTTAPNSLVLWLDGKDPLNTGTVPTNGTVIPTWFDKSGCGNNGTGQGSPTVVASGISFNGTDQFYKLPDGAIPYGNSSYTIIIAARFPDTIAQPGYYYGLLGAGLAYGSSSLSIRKAEDGKFSTYWYYNGPDQVADIFSSGTFTVNQTFIYSSAYTSGSKRRIYINGSTDVSDTPAARKQPPFNNTVGRTVANEFMKGTISEILIFNYELPATTRKTIEAYLAKKWAITGTSGLTMPATATPPSTVAVSPTNLPGANSLQLWVDATDPYGNGISPDSGTLISKFADKSGNGNHLTQAVVANQPVYNYDQSSIRIRTIAGASSPTTTQTLNIPVNVMNNLQTFSMFLVFRGTSATNVFMAKQHGGIDTTNVLSMGIYINSSLGWSADNQGRIYWHPYNNVNNVSAGTYGAGTTYLVSFIYDGQYNRIYQNGGGDATMTGYNLVSDVSPDYFTIGTPENIASDFNLNSLMIYKTALSDSQRQSVEGYLASKFNVTLPSGHPYKTTISPFTPRTLDTTSVGLTFDGLTNFYVTPYTPLPASETGFLVLTAPLVAGDVLAGTTTNGSATREISLNTARMYYGTMYNGQVSLATNSKALTTSNIYIYSFTYSRDTTTTNIYLNGLLVKSDTATLRTFNGTGKTTIGAYIDTGGTGALGFYNGTIYEIMLYNAVLSDTERINIEGYLAAKWNVQTDYSSMDGTLANAKFNGIQGLISDSNNNVYVVDTNTLRFVNMSNSSVTTVVGNGVASNAQGIGSNASLANPLAVTLNTNGIPYVTTFDNPTSIFSVNMNTSNLIRQYKTNTKTLAENNGDINNNITMMAIAGSAGVMGRLKVTGDIYYSGNLIQSGVDGVSPINVNSNGNVGIGTTTPTTALQVFGLSNSTWMTEYYIPPTTDTYFSVLSSNGYMDNLRTMIEVGSSGTGVGNFGSVYKYLFGFSNTGTVNGGNFIIQSMASSTTSYEIAAAANTRFTIRYDGNVGIGTTNPSNLFSLSGLGSYGLMYMKGTGNETSMMFNDPANANAVAGYTGWYVGQTTSWGAAMNSFGIARLSGSGVVGSTGLWISASGNVGIGVTNPLYALHINNTYNAANSIPILGTGDGQRITPGIKVGDLNIGALYANNGPPVIWSETSLTIQASHGTVSIPRNNFHVVDRVGIGMGKELPTCSLDVNGSINANEFLIGKDYEYSGSPGSFNQVGSYSLFRGAYRNIPTADLGSLRGGNAGGWIALSGYAPPVKSAIYLVYVTRSLPGAGRGYSTHLLQTWDTGGTNRQGNKNNWESTRITDANNGYWDDYVYIIDYYGNWANLGDGYIASRGNNSTNDILIVQLA